MPEWRGSNICACAVRCIPVPGIGIVGSNFILPGNTKIGEQAISRPFRGEIKHQHLTLIRLFEKWDVLCYRVVRDGGQVYARWFPIKICRDIWRILTKFGTQKHQCNTKTKFKPCDLDPDLGSIIFFNYNYDYNEATSDLSLTITG